jgi:hypothetical protein
MAIDRLEPRFTLVILPVTPRYLERKNMGLAGI